MDYGGTSQSFDFSIDTVIPLLNPITLRNLNYIDNTFTYLDGFKRNHDYKKTVYFDFSFNNFIKDNDGNVEITTKSSNIIVSNFSRTDLTTVKDFIGGKSFSGEIDISGEVIINNAYIRISYQGMSVEKEFSVNTKIPVINEEINYNTDNFSVSNRIIDISINTDHEILDTSLILLNQNFILVEPLDKWDILYLKKNNNNNTQWDIQIFYNKEITNVKNLKGKIKGKYRNNEKTIDFDISDFFPQVNSVEFERNIGFEYSESEIMNYKDMSGTIIVNFTTDLSTNRIEETLETLKQMSLIRITPRDIKFKIELNYSEISGNICKIIVNSKGEIKENNISINASYLGTSNKVDNLSINTIIPRPIDISLSLLEFNLENRDAIVSIKYDENILKETPLTMEEHIGYFIKPVNVIINDISQNQMNKKEWTAKLTTIGNILDSTGLIKAKYKDDKVVKSFNYLINTVIPFVKTNIGSTLQSNGLPRTYMSFNLTRNKALSEQVLIPEIYNYNPLSTSNDKYNKITINGNEFHPTQTHIKIDYGGKYSIVPNRIRVIYISPKKISFVFPQDLKKGYYYFRIVRLLYFESQAGAQRFTEYKEFQSNYSYYFHKQH